MWLEEQLREAEASYNNWPEWLKRYSRTREFENKKRGVGDD